jgi:hypothetical protein
LEYAVPIPRVGLGTSVRPRRLPVCPVPTNLARLNRTRER